MRGRVLILIGAIILLAVVAVVVLTSGGDEGGTEDGTGESTSAQGTPVPGEESRPSASGAGSGLIEQNLVEIVIAIQDLSRGLKIPADGVGTQLWPEQSLPEAGNYFTADQMGDVVGRIARTDIPRGAPVLRRQVVDDLYEIAASGSDAAALLSALPYQAVAVSIPLDPSGVGQCAYCIQDGDYVDVILSFLFVDVDPDFQTRLPNNYSVITRLETGELSIGAPRQGRTEASTLSPEGVLLGPSEPSQRPRLVTQRTVTDAFVLHVGYFPESGHMTPTPIAVQAAPTPAGEAQSGTPPTAVPTATAYAPTIITLAVTPQDALALVWAIDSQLPITLALRAAGDTTEVATDPVTLDYMIRTYNAQPPVALEFALEPPITSVRRFDIGQLYDFLAKSLGSPTQ